MQPESIKPTQTSDTSTPSSTLASASTPETPQSKRSRHRKILAQLATLTGLLLLLGSIGLWMTQWRNETTRTQPNTSPSATTPALDTEVMLSGRQHIWEIAFIPSGEMLFTERGGTLSVYTAATGKATAIPGITDVRAVGEGGLMGLAIDPQFTQNRFIYTCFNSTAADIRIARFRLSEDLTSLQDRQDIVTGIPSNTTALSPGRHSGCRIGFGPDSYLWAGTGDTAQGDAAIQPKNLGGKILRVARDGKPATGNIGGDYDPRIYSYGHRNVQGLAFFDTAKNGVAGLSAEHGPGIDDEINELKPGNFGWAPSPVGYDEQVPMTDLTRFPDAVPAVWSSGSITQAPAGAIIIKGESWKGWNGALAVAFLKAEHLKILHLDNTNHAIREERILSSEYGRLRAIVQGPDGSLYLGTSNGNADRIIKIAPKMN
ncbi:MAG: PQQ-dependent sugar dehydrogenase [Candidatus Saccharimonadales bacterium]